jgi:long-chain acyl-CoA synthetase
MKKDGLIPTVKNIIDYDADKSKPIYSEEGITVYSYAGILEMQDEIKLDEALEPKTNDLTIFCYTSGTTGDSKGVMITHRNILVDTDSLMEKLVDTDETSILISYLPLPHLFE